MILIKLFTNKNVYLKIFLDSKNSTELAIKIKHFQHLQYLNQYEINIGNQKSFD